MLTLNWNIIWTFVNLIVLFLLLKKFLFKPVMNVMEQRENMLKKQVEEAGQKEQLADKKLKDAELFLEDADKKARQEAAVILEATEKKNHALIEQAQQGADKILADSRSRANKEREKLLSDSQNEIVEIALQTAKKLAGTHINKQEEEQLFEQMLCKAGESHE